MKAVQTNSKKSKTIRVRASDSLHERLMRIAALKGVAASEIARSAIDEHLVDEEARIAQEGGSFPMGPLLSGATKAEAKP